MEDELRPGIRCDRGRAHYDPQYGSEVFRRHLEEENAIGKERDENAVESKADPPEHVYQYEHGRREIAECGGDRGPENHQRFRGDDGDQPATLDDVGAMSRIEKREHAEAEI